MHRRLRERLDLLHRGLIGVAPARPAGRARCRPKARSTSPRASTSSGRTLDGATLRTNDDIRKLLLQQAGIAVVPFQAFGLDREDGWFRLSVGAVSVAAIEAGLARLTSVLERVSR